MIVKLTKRCNELRVPGVNHRFCYRKLPIDTQKKMCLSVGFVIRCEIMLVFKLNEI